MSGWKLTGKQKTILNYTCTEAVKTDSLRTVTAWFTSAIPVPAGPENYVGLPGMVLEVNINNGETIIMAVSINAALDEEELVKPEDGKQVTEEEFNAIVDEKLKEMGVDRNSGPSVIIRIDEN
jgi:GLPGLI family protein